MSETAALLTQTQKALPSNSHSLLVQRKCACGGSSGLTGSCSGCEKKKLLGKPLQAKLRVNEPGDQYEQEADRVAEHLISMPINSTVNAAAPHIQRFTGQATRHTATAHAILDRVVASHGRSLEPELHRYTEQRFGYDFSRVRVHPDATAGQSAQDVNADAYTSVHDVVFGTGHSASATPAPRSEVVPRISYSSPADPSIHSPDVRLHHDDRAAAVARVADARAVTIGRNIYFGRGEYQPSTSFGRELLAHELVHVAQASRGTRGDCDAAESEANHLAPWLATGDGHSIRVSQPAAPVMCDRMPEPDLSQDRNKIRAELVAKYPWLAKLANRDLVETTFADFIALQRRNIELTRELNKLPDPTQTVLSEEIDRRNARRRPVERKLAKVIQQESDTPKNIRVDLRSLLHKDFLHGSSSQETAGREAVVAELANHRGSVGIWRHGLDSFGFSVGVFIDGVWIPADADGISLRSFFAERYAYYPLLEVQKAYYSGVAGSARQQLEVKVDESPWLAQRQLEVLQEESGEAWRQKYYPTEEEELVTEYRSAKKDYAEQVTAKTQAAVAPFVLLLGLFALEGPVDLLLTVVPVHKLGKAFKLGKAAIAARRTRKLAEKLVKEFGEHLDDEAKLFLKLASKLSKAEVRAIKTIHAAVGSQSVIMTLMDRSIRGTADVKWIAKKLESKKFDGEFVRTFTEFEAAPSWKTFQSVVEKQKISEDARSGLASQLVGFVGEEAAAKLAKTDIFAKAILKARKGAKLTVTRGVRYGDRSSFDLLGISDKAELVFGEVKNWAASTWSTGAKRTEIIDQLKRHNAGIPEITSGLYRRSTDVKAKVLFVAEQGFKDGLDAKALVKFKKEVSDLGWEIQLIPDSQIADFAGLIDRVR